MSVRRLPITSSIRNFVEAGRTSPDTRLIAMRTKPKARIPFRGATSALMSGRSARRRSDFGSFGRSCAEPARPISRRPEGGPSGSSSRPRGPPRLLEGDAPRRQPVDEGGEEIAAVAPSSSSGRTPGSRSEPDARSSAAMTHGKPVVRAIDVAPVFTSVRSKRSWTRRTGRPAREPRDSTRRTVNSSSPSGLFHCGEEERLGDRARRHPRAARRRRASSAEKPAVAQEAHLLGVPRPAQRLLAQVPRLHRLEDGAQAVRQEPLERPDARHVEAASPPTGRAS